MSDIYIAGGFQPTNPDTPLDARTVVEREKDIFDIKLPYVGMTVYVKSTKGLYVVTGLKDATMGSVPVPGYSVDTYDRLFVSGTPLQDMPGYDELVAQLKVYIDDKLSGVVS